jgi:hypothetical protein
VLQFISTQFRGLPVGPTRCVHTPYNWGDSEAQLGPSTEDWKAARLVRG